MSLVSVETGKTVAKSSKASVRNGTCQWTENIAESIRVPHRDSSKELEDCYYKLVLATVRTYAFLQMTAKCPILLLPDCISIYFSLLYRMLLKVPWEYLIAQILFHLLLPDLGKGSARSGILGEATINITDYARSTAESTVSVPLNKCNHGTTLQVSLQ